MSSCSRPGVPMSTVGGVDFRTARSLDREVAPPMRRLTQSTEMSSGGRTFRKPCRTV